MRLLVRLRYETIKDYLFSFPVGNAMRRKFRSVVLDFPFGRFKVLPVNHLRDSNARSAYGSIQLRSFKSEVTVAALIRVSSCDERAVSSVREGGGA